MWLLASVIAGLGAVVYVVLGLCVIGSRTAESFDQQHDWGIE